MPALQTRPCRLCTPPTRPDPSERRVAHLQLSEVLRNDGQTDPYCGSAARTSTNLGSSHIHWRHLSSPPPPTPFALCSPGWRGHHCAWPRRIRLAFNRSGHPRRCRIDVGRVTTTASSRHLTELALVQPVHWKTLNNVKRTVSHGQFKEKRPLCQGGAGDRKGGAIYSAPDRCQGAPQACQEIERRPCRRARVAIPLLRFRSSTLKSRARKPISISRRCSKRLTTRVRKSSMTRSR